MRKFTQDNSPKAHRNTTAGAGINAWPLGRYHSGQIEGRNSGVFGSNAVLAPADLGQREESGRFEAGMTIVEPDRRANTGIGLAFGSLRHGL